MTELRLIRVFERIELLKDAGRWGYRQPKKQRGIGGLAKSHWDYLLDEMVSKHCSFLLLHYSHSPTSDGCKWTFAKKDGGSSYSRTNLPTPPWIGTEQVARKNE
jgi:hypothetical protein